MESNSLFQKELNEALTRMDKRFRQSQTIKNPNHLDQILKKEKQSDFVKFTERFPEKSDFPVYVYYERFESLDLIQHLEDLKVEKNSQIPPDLFWCKKFMGD